MSASAPPAAHLLRTPEEEQLASGLRAMLAAHLAFPDLLARIETGEPYDPKPWAVLARQMGLAGLPVAEEHEGGGATWREAAVVAHELGRAAAPTPFLGSAVLATAALLSAGDAGLLADLAAGRRTATLAIPCVTAPGAAFPAAVAAADGGLTGRVTSVIDAAGADVLLVPAVGAGGPALYAVEPGDSRVTRSPVMSLDLTRPQADIAFASAPGRVLARGPAAREAVDRALLAGAVVLASEQVGLADHCLDSTVAYLGTRHQFGRPVGSFQAVKHRLAALWVALTQARTAARYAAACLAQDDPDTPVAAAVAQAFCSEAAVRAAEECVQLHGGIGFTWEHHAHVYLKRAKSDALLFGGPDRHRARLSALVDLPAPE